MLAYLTILYDPSPAPFVGIEEPENQLFPFLMSGLAEECRDAVARTQVLVTTHSPQLVSALRPQELRILERDKGGFTQVTLASNLPAVMNHFRSGATLGDLWLESYFATDVAAV